MSIASNLLGRSVPGTKIEGDWSVTERLTEPLNLNGYGRAYGYKVQHASGRQAFLKAVDADMLDDEGETLAVRLMAVLMHHTFEAQVSDHCRGNNMDRVTLAIDHGSTLIVHDGVKEPVFYLIFELADRDIRQQILIEKDWSPQKKFRLLHHVAVGISQLHAAQVSHNDLKPPNILQFRDEHKISDLGQATREDAIAPYEHLAVVGDPRYAAPETLYAKDGSPGTRLLSNEQRKAGDLYLLGSLIHFLFGERMMTPMILDQLNPVHLPPFREGGWQGTFVDVLPYWRHTQTEQLHQFSTILHSNQNLAKYANDILMAVSELCEPDPQLRGHPVAVRRGNNYALQHYISLFNRLSTTYN